MLGSIQSALTHAGVGTKLRAVKALVRLLATLMVLVPIGLGPALMPVLRVFHEMGHTCACGMAPGKCGCPACARLENERRHGPGAIPVLKATCDDDGTTLPSAPLPPCALQSDAVAPFTLDESMIAIRAVGPPKVRGADGPPTPPPRCGGEVPQIS